jgi:hypothetical protein
VTSRIDANVSVTYIYVMLRREGWVVNKKRVLRLYRLQGLQLRMLIRRRKHMCLHRSAVPRAQRTVAVKALLDTRLQ